MRGSGEQGALLEAAALVATRVFPAGGCRDPLALHIPPYRGHTWPHPARGCLCPEAQRTQWRWFHESLRASARQAAPFALLGEPAPSLSAPLCTQGPVSLSTVPAPVGSGGQKGGECGGWMDRFAQQLFDGRLQGRAGGLSRSQSQHPAALSPSWASLGPRPPPSATPRFPAAPAQQLGFGMEPLDVHHGCAPRPPHGAPRLAQIPGALRTPQLRARLKGRFPPGVFSCRWHRLTWVVAVARAHLWPLLVAPSATSHWPKQVTWASSTARGRKFTPPMEEGGEVSFKDGESVPSACVSVTAWPRAGTHVTCLPVTRAYSWLGR